MSVEFKENIFASEYKLLFTKAIKNTLNYYILARTFKLAPTIEQVIFFVRTNTSKLFYLVNFL